MILYEHTLPAWIIWLMILSVTGVTVYAFAHFLTRSLFTVMLLLLRVLFLILMGWCLFQPEWRKSLTDLLKPRLAVAVDASASMGLRPADDASNRWETVRSILNDSWPRMLERQCEIDAYTFAGELHAEPDLATIQSRQPNGNTTHLRDALNRLRERYRGQRLLGVLLLTDGLDTMEAGTSWTEEPWPWPIYTARLEPHGSWQEEPELRVENVETPRRVSLGWTTEVTALISGQGTKGQPINAQLLVDGEVDQESPVQIAEGGGTREVRYRKKYTELGVSTLTVRIRPFPGETHTNDNAYSVTVQVVDPRNRVLYVEGHPRWESKYLTRVLEGNDQITPLCFLRGPNRKFITIGRRGDLTPDMTEEQLGNFKIVIIGNLDGRELGEERAKNLVEFVEAGGSLVVAGGPKTWGKEGLLTTALAQALPIRKVGNEPVQGKFDTALTDEGRSHPAFAGEGLWSRLPPVLSVFPDAALSPAAQPLVTAQTPSGRYPIIVAQRYGQGKVLCTLTDSLWRWTQSAEPTQVQPYHRFWQQMLSWLCPTEEELAPFRMEIFADKEQLFLGEELKLSARMGGHDGKEISNANVQCLIETPDGRTLPFPMGSQPVVTPSGQSFPGYASVFEARSPGLHIATAVAEVDGNEITSDPISFFVRPFTPESVPRPANTDQLKMLASQSSGRFFETRDELTRFLASLQAEQLEEERVTYSSLWANIPVISCLLALLSIEWILRKWRNMP